MNISDRFFSSFTALAKAMLASFLFMAPAKAEDAVVLVYHRFGEDHIPSTNIRLDQFDAQLDWLVKNGTQFPSLQQLTDALNGGPPLPDKSVIFTVDDAYRSAAEEAWPRLKTRGIPMALFVATQSVDEGRQGYLSWDEIRALKEDGVTIGFHGHAHRHMAYGDLAQVEADLQQGLARFSQELGTVSPYFAYPYGEFSLALKDHIKAAGFDLAFAQYSAPVGAHNDPHALPRFAMNERYGALERFKTIALTRSVTTEVLTPKDPLLSKPLPQFQFQVIKAEKGWERMSCFPSHMGKAAPLRIQDQNITVDLEQPLPFGRSRVNCTYLGADGRWRWIGQPFFKEGGVLD